MKRKGFLLVLLLFIAPFVFAQMPEGLLSTFKSMYPQAQVNKIKQDKDNYLISFVNDNKKGKAYFDGKGNWLQTEIQLKWKTMPPVVRIGLRKTRYTGWMIYDTKEIIVHADTTYMFEVNSQNTQDAFGTIAKTEDYNLFFSSKGDMIKEEKLY